MGAGILGGLLGGMAAGKQAKENRQLVRTLMDTVRAKDRAAETTSGTDTKATTETSGGAGKSNAQDTEWPEPKSRGGRIERTGVYKLHKGEFVLSRKAMRRLHKEYRKLRKTKRS